VTTLTRALRPVLDRALPAPPNSLRRGPFRDLEPSPGASTSAHDVRSAALLGRALGMAIAVCFTTGLVSHVHQHPAAWLDLPSRPVWGYQVTQGLHVAAGLAAIPLVLAKLWVVYRHFFTWPPARTVGHALERALLAPLVAGTLFEVTSGLLNIVQWYPWPFYFPRVHYAVAWIVVGSLLVHLAVKAPRIRAGLAASTGAPRAADGETLPDAKALPNGEALLDGEVVVPDGDRRALLLGVAGAVGLVTLATVGQTVAPLRAVSVLAPRDPDRAPQGVPVNRTASAAAIAALATDPGWRLTVAGPRTVSFSLAELQALPQTEVELPIACVEGWSVTARWSGVRLRDLLDLAGLDLAGVDRGVHLQAVSLETGWLYGSSPIGPSIARDPLSLLATRLNGEVLTLDHGYPLRLIAPNRPGVHQTKWLSRIEVV